MPTKHHSRIESQNTPNQGTITKKNAPEKTPDNLKNTKGERK